MNCGAFDTGNKNWNDTTMNILAADSMEFRESVARLYKTGRLGEVISPSAPVLPDVLLYLTRPWSAPNVVQ